MHHYHNLLYVGHGTADETSGLKQALNLARNNNAPLSVLVVSPPFPAEFPSYRKKFEQSLIAQTEASIRSSREAMGMEPDTADIPIRLVSGKTLSIQIIRYVLQHGHDLVIKEAEPLDSSDAGFKALDMHLLRKCPCAVWLSRPIQRSREKIRVAVAVDPEEQQQQAADLSRRLLQLSRSLTDNCSGTLYIISCWEYEFESFLRHNARVDVGDAELMDTIVKREQQHREALDNLIETAGITGRTELHHRRGQPEVCIPAFVREHGVDILVMGTVARTGISGFLVGNTAENTFQNLSCSLLALKPHGFVSPVRAY